MRRPSAKTIIVVAAAVVAVVLAWPRLPFTAARALDGADKYELLSLDWERSESPSPDDFYRHRVLGHTEIDDGTVRQRLNAALRHGVESPLTSLPMCFNPRHGIRVVRGGHETDFLICFECHQVQVWRDGHVVATWTTDASPKAAFDEALKSAGVPLPKPVE